VTAERPVDVSAEQIAATLDAFRGPIRQRVPSHGLSRHIGAGITGPRDQEDEENQQGAVGQPSREHKIAEREAEIEHAHDQHHAVRE